MRKKIIISTLFQLIAFFAFSQLSVGFKAGVNKQPSGLGLPNLFYETDVTVFPENDATYSFAISIENKISRLFSLRAEPGYFKLNKFEKLGYSTDYNLDNYSIDTRFNSKIEYISLPFHFILSPTSEDSKILFKAYAGTGLGYISKLSSVGETFEVLDWGEYVNHPLSAPDIEDYSFEKRLHSLICFGMELGFRIKNQHALSFDLNFTNNYFTNKDFTKYAVDQFGAMNIGLRYLFVLGVE